MKEYKDPLHVPYQDLVVYHKGEEAVLLNKRLLDQKNCWNNLEGIKALHSLKLHIYDMMKNTTSKKTLKSYDKLLTELEFNLQDLWGFPRDAKFHRFWEREKCKCPSMDNSDAYPYRQYINGDCPLHGK